MLKCNRCGREFEDSLDFYVKDEVRVASCRACPVDNVYTVCEKCEDVDKIELESCPGCGAWNMWEIRKMVPVEH